MKINLDDDSLVETNVIEANNVGANEQKTEKSRHRNAVDGMFGNVSSVIDSSIKMNASESEKKLADIPINMIKNRDINEYPVDRIEQLAEDIEKVGLIQPIVVRKNKDRSDYNATYIVVVGHRRLAAYRYLKSKYQSSESEVDKHGFDSITAYILESDEELKNEEQIYRSSNDQMRRISNLDRVIRLKPDEIDLSSDKWKREYVEEVLGKDKLKDYEEKKIIVPTGSRAKAKLIAAMISNDDPTSDISDNTVRTYLMFLERCGDNLRKATIRRMIPQRDAINYISFWRVEEQEKAIAAFGKNDEEYKKYLKKPEEISKSNSSKITWSKAKNKVKRSIEKATSSIENDLTEWKTNGLDDEDSKKLEKILDELKQIEEKIK